MNTQVAAQPLSQRDPCPYRGQPVTHQKLEEIRGRVRAEGQRRHDAARAAQEEALRGLERFAGQVHGRVGAMVEGRDAK